MERTGATQVLKRSLTRSVRLEPAPSDEVGALPRVVKRFASGGPLASTRDRARARRERDLLAELSALGLPVPRPLALEACEGGWEVAMEWIPRAQPLSTLLDGQAGWPTPRAVAARELGKLLARLQAIGVDHPDLHPGNALMDADGRAWVIDFHKARRVTKLSRARVEAQLVHLAAGVRESTSRRFRARFLWSWWQALPIDLRPDAGALADLARRTEAQARRERLPTVDRRRLRWTRDGTAVRPVQLAGGEGFERADREPGLARTFEAELERRGATGPRTLLPCPGGRACRALVVRGTWRTVAPVWYAAARLEEHRLPAARPLAIARGTRVWAAFQLPAHGHVPAAWDELRDRRTLAAIGALAAALHDRGLRPTRLVPDMLWTNGLGKVQLTCLSGLARALDLAPARALRPWCTVLGAGPAERAALAAGFVAALDLSRAEREALRDDLRRG